MASFARDIFRLSGKYRNNRAHNLNLSNEKKFHLPIQVVVHDVGTAGHVGSWERLVSIGVRFEPTVQS